MTRIFLTGYMGSGKTTLGRALATEMAIPFIDLDHYIEKRYCKTIAQLFAEKGEEGFRDIERRMLHEVGEFEDVIISTGGGTPCFFDNIEYMNAQGTTVFLEASVDVIYTRLTIARTQRPLVAGKTEEELRRYITDMLELRTPYYRQASHTFCANRLEDICQVEESVKLFKKHILQA